MYVIILICVMKIMWIMCNEIIIMKIIIILIIIMIIIM